VTGQLAKDIWDRTTETGQLAGTGQSGQVSLIGQSQWVSLDRTERTGLPGKDSGIKRLVDKGIWAAQLEQDSRGRATGTGQLVQDGRDRTARQDI
jgi:hypothetical protein